VRQELTELQRLYEADIARMRMEASDADLRFDFKEEFDCILKKLI
jgi:hypothetical protein